MQLIRRKMLEARRRVKRFLRRDRKPVRMRAAAKRRHFGNRHRRPDHLSSVPMSTIGNPRRARRHPAAFLLWGWAMLLVVLLSAAPTGGPPRTRLLGSAFDPASVSVVLSPKQVRVNASTSSPNKRKPGEAMGGLSRVANSPRLPALQLLAAAPLAITARREPITLPLSFTRANAPRAPPLA
jgi:hypothetical protein